MRAVGKAEGGRKGKAVINMSNRLPKLMIVVISAVGISLSAISSSSYGGPPAQDGASLFKGKCATCHAADGSGNTAMGKKFNLRDLRSKEVQSQSDDQLYNIIAKGKGKMPPYEKSLGADKCRQLVAQVRKLAK